MDRDDPLHGNQRPDMGGGFEGARVVVEGSLIRVCVLGPVALPLELLQSLAPLLSLPEVMGQLLVVVGEAIGIELLDGVAHRPVQFLPALD